MRGGRQVWLSVHRWVGLGLGAVLMLIGLTGSAIVFYREIDARLHPALFTPGGPDAGLTFNQVLAIARAAAPDPVVSIRAPDAVWPVWIAYHQIGRGPEAATWGTHIDPSDGRVLGRRDFMRSPVMTVYSLHYALLLQPWWGKEMVGILGGVLLVSCLSGLWLWWPARGWWRAATRLRRRPGTAFLHDLHNLVGFWGSALLIAVTFSGIAVVFPNLLPAVLPDTAPLPRPVVAKRDGMPPVDADRAVAIARTALPGQVVTLLLPPQGPTQAWRLRLRPAGADTAVTSLSQVWIDPWDGRIVDERIAGRMSAGNAFLSVQLWLHNGALAGLGGRLAVLASGLALPALFVTGLLLWLRRRPAPRPPRAVGSAPPPQPSSQGR